MPEARQDSRSPTIALAVSAIIHGRVLLRGYISTNRRAASRPSISGICMSRKMMS